MSADPDIEMAEAGVDEEEGDEEPSFTPHNAAEGHDRPGHEDKFDYKRVLPREKRWNALYGFFKGKLRLVKPAAAQDCAFNLVFRLAAEPLVDIDDARNFIDAYLRNPNQELKETLEEARVLKSNADVVKRQKEWDTMVSDLTLKAATRPRVAQEALEEAQEALDAARKAEDADGEAKAQAAVDEAQAAVDGTTGELTKEDAKLVSAYEKSRDKETHGEIFICDALSGIVARNTEFAAAKETLVDPDDVTKMRMGEEAVKNLYKSRKLPYKSIQKRIKLAWSNYPEFCKWYDQHMQRQIQKLKDDKDCTDLPQVTEEDVEKWILGKYDYSPEALAGPNNWELMIKAYEGKFVPFNEKDKNDNRIYSTEHISDSASCRAHSDRKSMFAPMCNNKYSFACLPMVLNGADGMKDGTSSVLKLGFFGKVLMDRARQWGQQKEHKSLVIHATASLLQAYRDGTEEYTPIVYSHSRGGAEVVPRTISKERDRERVRTAKGGGYDELLAKTQAAKRQREIKEAQEANSDDDDSDTPGTEKPSEESESEHEQQASAHTSPGSDGAGPSGAKGWLDSDAEPDVEVPPPPAAEVGAEAAAHRRSRTASAARPRNSNASGGCAVMGCDKSVNAKLWLRFPFCTTLHGRPIQKRMLADGALRARLPALSKARDGSPEKGFNFQPYAKECGLVLKR